MSLTPWVLRLSTEIPAHRGADQGPAHGDEHDLVVGVDQHGADLLAVALGATDGQHALAAAPLGGEVLHRGALAVAVLGDRQHGAGAGHHQRDDPLPVLQGDAAHALGVAPGGTDLVLAEAHRLAGGGEQHQFLVAVGEIDPDEDVVVRQVHGDDAAGQGTGELGQRGLLDHTLAGGHEDEEPRLVGAHREHGVDALALLQRQQVDHGPAAGGAARLGQFVDLEPVDPAAAGEAQHGVVGVGDEELVDEVLVLGGRRRLALAAAALGLVFVERLGLDVTPVGEGDHHVLRGYQVLQGQVHVIHDDLAATRVGVLVADGGELGVDDLHQLRGPGEDLQQAGYGLEDLLELAEDLVLLQARELLQAQVQDRLGLDLAQAVALGGEAQPRGQVVGPGVRGPGALQHGDHGARVPDPLHEADLGLGGARRGADQGDDGLDIGQGDGLAFEDVGALAGLAQLEQGPAGHHIAAVAQEVFQELLEVQGARLAVHQGDHVDAEDRLQLAVLEEVVQHDLGVLAALQVEDHAQAVLVGLIAHLRDALDLLLLHQFGDALEHARLVDLVGDLGDDDGLAGAALLGLDVAARPHDHPPAPGAVALADAADAVDDAGGGEVRPRDVRPSGHRP